LLELGGDTQPYSGTKKRVSTEERRQNGVKSLKMTHEAKARLQKKTKKKQQGRKGNKSRSGRTSQEKEKGPQKMGKSNQEGYSC